MNQVLLLFTGSVSFRQQHNIKKICWSVYIKTRSDITNKDRLIIPLTAFVYLNMEELGLAVLKQVKNSSRSHNIFIP